MEINTDIDAAGYWSFGFVPDGVGKDGMPLYKEQLMITIARPPELLIQRKPEDDDFRRYAPQYEAFKRQNEKRKLQEGYPLTMWPVVSLAELNMCHARDIVTVQQLAAARTLPPQLSELGLRAKQLIELQGKTGKFEKVVSDLKAQVAALQEQLKECNATIAAQNSLIATMPVGKAA